MHIFLSIEAKAGKNYFISDSRLFLFEYNNSVRVTIGNLSTGTDYIKYIARDDSAIGNRNQGSVSMKIQNNLWITGLIVITSDKRIKKNVTELIDGESIELLRKIKPCRYNYIDDLTKGTQSVIGFIAQEIAKNLPSAVSSNHNEFKPDFYQLVELEGNNIYHLTCIVMK